MRIASRFDALGFRGGARVGMRPDVVSGQGVGAFDGIAEVGGQLAGTKCRTVLNANAMLEKQRQINGHNCLPRRFALVHDIEPKRASVLQLIETEVPELHCLPLSGTGSQPKPGLSCAGGG